MKKIRYFFRLLGSFLMRFKLQISISLFVGILISALYIITAPYLFTLLFPPRIGVVGRFRVEDLPMFFTSQISRGLTSSDSEGYLIPGLAKSWTTPDGGKTWIFTLDTSIRWHDSSPLSSNDINYDFSDVEIERPDRTTIVFKLKEIYSPFAAVVTRPIFKKGLVGTGDWKVTKVVLTENYVTYIKMSDTKSKKEKIYKFFPNEDQVKLSYKLGEIDEIYNLYDPKPFNTWPTSEIKERIDPQQTVTLFFNTKDPILSDKSLRQALTYALDKESFEGKRALSPLPENLWAYNPQVKTYDYNVERSKEILKDYQKNKKEELTISLVTTPTLLSVAEKIANSWEVIGVKSTVLVSSVIPDSFQTYLSIYEAPLDPDQYPIWHSTQTSVNISHFENPRIDKLLEDGRIEIDIEKRRKIYLDFQRYLLEDLPAAFLYHPYIYSVTRR